MMPSGSPNPSAKDSKAEAAMVNTAENGQPQQYAADTTSMWSTAYTYIHSSLPNKPSLQSLTPAVALPSPVTLKNYASTLGATIQSHTQQYITTAATALQRTNDQLNKPQPPKPLHIRWKSLQQVICGGLQHQWLICALRDGFQIYALYCETDVRLVASHSLEEGMQVEHVTVISSHDNSQSHAATAQCTSCNPLLAFTTAANTEGAMATELRIFNLVEQRYILQQQFPSAIHSVDVSSSVIAVSLQDEIHLFSNPLRPGTADLQLPSITPCYPNTHHNGVVALGDRFFAYQPHEPINSNTHSSTLPNMRSPSASPHAVAAKSHIGSPNMSPLLNGVSSNNITLSPLMAAHSGTTISPQPQPLVHSSQSPLPAQQQHQLPPSVETFGSVARNVASSIYNLGGYSKQKVSQYINNSEFRYNSSNSLASLQSNGSNPTVAGDAAAGTVIIRDLQTQRVVASFRHFNVPLIALHFDRTGTLLAVVPADGQYIHIYKLYAARDGKHDTLHTASSGQLSISCIYRLFRGITHATIRTISFSSDSKWVTVSSHSGTTHVYAINPHGGKVSYATHAADSMKLSHCNRNAYLLGTSDSMECYTINPRYRLKHPTTIYTNPSSNNSDNKPEMSAADVAMVKQHLNNVTPLISGLLPAAAGASVDHLVIMNDSDELLTYSLQCQPSLRGSAAGHSSDSNHIMNGLLSVNSRQSPSTSPRHAQARGSPLVRPNSASGKRSLLEHSDSANNNHSKAKLDVVVTLAASFALGDISNSALIAEAADRRLPLPHTQLSSYFAELQQAHHSARHESSQLTNASLVHERLQQARWAAQAELQPYVANTSTAVPIYASPQFTLFTYVALGSQTANAAEAQTLVGCRVQPLVYDKHKTPVDPDAYTLHTNPSLMHHLNGKTPLLNDQMDDAISTSVSHHRDNENDDLSCSPSTTIFSPRSFPYDHQLNNDQLELQCKPPTHQLFSSESDSGLKMEQHMMEEYFATGDHPRKVPTVKSSKVRNDSSSSSGSTTDTLALQHHLNQFTLQH